MLVWSIILLVLSFNIPYNCIEFSLILVFSYLIFDEILLDDIWQVRLIFLNVSDDSLVIWSHWICIWSHIGYASLSRNQIAIKSNWLSIVNHQIGWICIKIKFLFDLCQLKSSKIIIIVHTSVSILQHLFLIFIDLMNY